MILLPLLLVALTLPAVDKFELDSALPRLPNNFTEDRRLLIPFPALVLDGDDITFLLCASEAVAVLARGGDGERQFIFFFLFFALGCRSCLHYTGEVVTIVIGVLLGSWACLLLWPLILGLLIIVLVLFAFLCLLVHVIIMYNFTAIITKGLGRTKSKLFDSTILIA